MNDQIMTISAQNESKQDSEQPLYISAIIKSMDVEHRPDPSPACETCPMSMWFNTDTLLKCFCGKMHSIVWEPGSVPILKCDGRELAILMLLAEKNS